MTLPVRQHFRSLRRSLTFEQQEEAANAVTVSSLTLIKTLKIRQLSAYWPSDGEISPLKIVSECLKLGLGCTLPVIRKDQSLRFARLEPNTQYDYNRYHIAEPQVPDEQLLNATDHDALLLPLTAYSRSGQRLGMGGGYFDRTLAACAQAPGRPYLIGLAHAFQEAEFESNPWDIDLDYVITPVEVIEISSPL